jgi:hypothetical protein
MEFMLLWWDELDDWAGACRHVAGEVVSEVASVVAPVGTALIAGSATAWAVLTHLHHHFPGA